MAVVLVVAVSEQVVKDIATLASAQCSGSRRVGLLLVRPAQFAAFCVLLVLRDEVGEVHATCLLVPAGIRFVRVLIDDCREYARQLSDVMIGATGLAVIAGQMLRRIRFIALGRKAVSLRK